MLIKAYIKTVVWLIGLNIFLTIMYVTVGDSRTLDITPQNYPFSVETDRFWNGASVADIKLNKDKATMSCELKESDYQWPYCEFTILLSQQIDQGIDLSNFEQVKLDIDYQGPTNSSERVRFYIRNFEPNVSKHEDHNSLKYNGVEFRPGFGEGIKEVSFDKFQVLTWWIFDYNVPVSDSSVNVNNVPMLQLATDSGSVLGKHTITINKILFQGHYISFSRFVVLLLSIWIGAAVVFLFNSLRHSRHHARILEQRTHQLSELNKALQDKYEIASQLALQDELTGASNRHAIRGWLEKTAQQVRAGTSQLSIIYIDLDDFKLVNDKYGHDVGDEVLCQFVNLIQSFLRSDDHLVRWGGEEFILFCPNTSLEDAVQMAEDIRIMVEQFKWPTVNHLTCSLGVTEMSSEEDGSTMITRADEALYNAKKFGRNRVEVL
ncbi:MAG: GGDEF domain-containing protein [Vibrio sp.]